MRWKIMLVDDDPGVAKVLDLILKAAGYSIIHCYSGREAVDKLAACRPDLVLMDVLLGDADGAELCRRIRQDPGVCRIPVILMSASRKAAKDVVAGLRQGADDFLPKPLDPQMLVAKIEAVLRRCRPGAELEEPLERYGIELDAARRRVRVDGREVALTRKEFDLLTVLLRNAGKVMSPKYLLETVWGCELEDYNDTATVQVHVSRLKKKLGPPFSDRIQNVIGVGYELV